jgi:hypothetical protein
MKHLIINIILLILLASTINSQLSFTNTESSFDIGKFKVTKEIAASDLNYDGYEYNGNYYILSRTKLTAYTNNFYLMRSFDLDFTKYYYQIRLGYPNYFFAEGYFVFHEYEGILRVLNLETFEEINHGGIHDINSSSFRHLEGFNFVFSMNFDDETTLFVLNFITGEGVKEIDTKVSRPIMKYYSNGIIYYYSHKENYEFLTLNIETGEIKDFAPGAGKIIPLKGTNDILVVYLKPSLHCDRYDVSNQKFYGKKYTFPGAIHHIHGSFYLSLIPSFVVKYYDYYFFNLESENLVIYKLMAKEELLNTFNLSEGKLVGIFNDKFRIYAY